MALHGIEPQNNVPIVYEPRPGALILVENALQPNLNTTLQLAAISLRQMDGARAIGDEASASQFECELEYFSEVIVDIIAMMDRHIGGEYSDIHKLIQAARSARGAIQ
ncbi:MAG: hypothetical protein HY795_15680 [Desulfovibrio sp.]|nr:hypothetical protein [Desulfovibrio sp.]MBI4958738.1 hypothetical protein [Desulfovibrio sp.]